MKWTWERGSAAASVHLVILLVSLHVGDCIAQQQTTVTHSAFKYELKDLAAPQATSESRALLLEQFSEDNITSAFATSLTNETEEAWSDALWAVRQRGLDTPAVQKVIRSTLSRHQTLDPEMLRSILETAYTLNPRVFRNEVASVADVTTNPKHFAMSCLYTVRAASDANFESVRRRRLTTLERHFPQWNQDPILVMLNHDLRVGRFARKKPFAGKDGMTSPSIAHPPVRHFLSPDFAPGFPVVYSLHRPNRDYPGLAVIRNRQGRFVRTEFGNVFHVPHLARSKSNLPGYITNGNTPQGIFSVNGLGVSRNRAIGRTPYLATVLPFEATPDIWFHDDALKGTTWTVEMYQHFLPEKTTAGSTGGEAFTPETTWRDFFPVYEAWFAGQAGRFDMLSHGTTVDPAFYWNDPWYPNTPTIGCICAKEIWHPDTGQALLSDQLALVKAWIAASREDDEPVQFPTSREAGPDGYFVVLELDDKPAPVTLDEVVMDLLAAENQ